MAWEIHVRQLLQQPVQQAVSYERAKDTLEFVENETKIYILFRTEKFQEKTKNTSVFRSLCIKEIKQRKKMVEAVKRSIKLTGRAQKTMEITCFRIFTNKELLQLNFSEGPFFTEKGLKVFLTTETTITTDVAT